MCTGEHFHTSPCFLRSRLTPRDATSFCSSSQAACPWGSALPRSGPTLSCAKRWARLRGGQAQWCFEGRDVKVET